MVEYRILQFRKDINGLRAIAVMAVVLFHFNADWAPGGFAGVDVFFVISGFLMTSIILRGIEQENFSIMKFYIARANRIVPALAVLCLALLVFGWFYLIPLDYKALGEHAGASISFLSNIVYWYRGAGYFDTASHEKWLLHTWSLSVEWQFYILYPLLLIAINKFLSINSIRVFVLVGAILGFIVSIVATYLWPDASYYLLHTRAWEMMLGGVAYLYPFKFNSKGRRVVECLGLVLIVFSCILISKNNFWPGYLAIFPVFGSFLIIQAQRDDSLITCNVIFQKIGTWSYSIYLWHWPLVVAIHYYALNEYFIYFGIGFSILLGFLSNKYIESIKFKGSFTNTVSYFKCKHIYIVFILGLLSSSVFISQGFKERFELPPEVSSIDNQLVIPYRSNGYCFYSSHENFIVDKQIGTSCYLGEKEKTSSTLLFGDSYAGHNEPFFDEVFKANNESFKSVATNWCVPSLTDSFTGPKSNLAYKQCLINREYLKDNAHSYENIIFAGSWDDSLSDGFFDEVESAILFSAEKGARVFIMAAPYKYKRNPLQSFYKSLYFDVPFNINSHSGNDIERAKANSRLKKLAGQYKNIHFIDRTLLYPEENTFNVNGVTVPYSFDGRHISMLGSKHSAIYFMNHRRYNEIMALFSF